MEPVRGRLLVVVALMGVLAASCRNGAGNAGGRTEQQVAALTATPSASSVARDQSLADSFTHQAAIYAQLAAAARAQSAALSTAIAAEVQQVTARATAAAESTAPVPAVSAVPTAGSTVAGATPLTNPGVPPAAENLESYYQKEAALADRLGANAQRLASFHLARLAASAGAAGTGGAR